MIREDRNIDKLFRNHLSGYREKPPLVAWDRINRDLDRRRLGSTIYRFRNIAAIIVLMIAFGGGYLLSDYLNRRDIPLSVAERPGDIKEDITAPDSRTDPVKPIEEQVNSQKEMASSGNISPGMTTKTKTDRENEDRPDQTVTVSGNMKMETPVTTGQEIAIQKDSEQPGEEKAVTITDGNVDLLKRNKSDEKDLNLLLPGNEKVIPVPEKSGNRWELGANLAPVYSYRAITPGSQTSSVPGQSESKLNQKEDAIVTLSASLDLGYALNDRAGIRAGICYSEIGQTSNGAYGFRMNGSDYKMVMLGTSAGNMSGKIQDLPQELTLIQNIKDTVEVNESLNLLFDQRFRYMELPFLFRYKLVDKKMRVNVSGGLSTAILVGNTNRVTWNNETYQLGKLDNLNTLLYNSVFCVGFDYRLSRKIHLSLEPTVKYALRSVNRDSQYYYYPYSFSVMTGLRYGF